MQGLMLTSVVVIMHNSMVAYDKSIFRNALLARNYFAYVFVNLSFNLLP